MNYTELTQAVQDYTENSETTFVSNIPNFIRSAEERILYTVKLPSFRRTVTGTLNGDSKYLEPPADFLSPDSVAVLIDDTWTQLLIKEPSFIVEAFPDDGYTGEPKYYAYVDDVALAFGPTPDADYDIEMQYFYYPESVVDSGNSWLSTNAENAMLYGALVEAYIFMKGEDNLIARYETRFQEALQRLKAYGDGLTHVDENRVAPPRGGWS